MEQSTEQKQYKSSVRIEQTKFYKISDEQIVKVTRYNARPILDVMAMNAVPINHLKNFKKLNKDEYYDKRNDTVKAYKHNKFKTEKAVKRSMLQLEKILLNNFSGEHNEIFVTLTTREDTIDINVIKQYYDEFWNRIKSDYDGLEYACVYEMQQTRESWHIHAMLKDLKHKSLYIANKYIEEKYWCQGETRTTDIRDIEQDFEIDEEKAMTEPNGYLAAKHTYGIDKVISYMRKYETKETLPTGVRAYSTSRNIKKPASEKVKYNILKQEVNATNVELLDEYATNIVSNNTDKILNTIRKERWLKKC